MLVFTADAVSMYTSIDLDHAMQVMCTTGCTQSQKFSQLGQQSTVPQAILDGIDLLMQNKLMKFGDTYASQLIGTAMVHSGHHLCQSLLWLA